MPKIGSMASVRDWPGRVRAERLRQWPTLVSLPSASLPFLRFGALILLGHRCPFESPESAD
jgi:hypothetical protein